MTTDDRLAYLLESEFTPTHTGVTLAMIRDVLSPEEYAMVRLDLEAATVPKDDTLQSKLIAAEIVDALAAMRSSSGLSLSPHDRQGTIDQLAVAGQWPDSVRDTVKALGGISRPRWQIQGLEVEPTLESVQEIIAAEAIREAARQKLIEIQARRQRWDAVSAIIRSRIETDAVSSIESILEAVESEWGSN
jgi:hypothetical protein